MNREYKTNSEARWYYSRKQLIAITGMSRDTIDRLEKRGRFPRRIFLSTRKIGWKVEEVLKWREERDLARFDAALCDTIPLPDVIGEQHSSN